MNIDFRYLEWLNIISESLVPITGEEANFLMDCAVKRKCRICQEKVRMIARNSGLITFDDTQIW